MSDTFETLTETMKERFEKIGLYLKGVNVNGVPMNEEIQQAVSDGSMTDKDALQSGLADFFIGAEFKINKIAWTDKVLRPEKAQTEKDFKLIVPDDDPEVKLARARAILEGLEE